MLQVHHLPLPELIFELSIGEVVIILIVTALILLVITIERTGKTITKTKPAYASPLLAMKECPARFGFLQKLSKGSTIPQECYICPLLIECLGFKRTPRTQS